MDTLLDRRTLLRRGAAAALVAPPLWRSALIPSAAAPMPPRGVHLSFTGDTATTATATWFTDGLDDPGAAIEFGPLGDLRGDDVQRAPFEHQADGGAGAPAPGVAAVIHGATMSGLAPGERVRYRVGRPGAWSPVRTFAPATAGDGFRFAHLGDHGCSADSVRTVELLCAERPDLIVHAGDLGYANGDQPVWDRWFGVIEPAAAEIPWMAAPGNHENEDGTGSQTFKARLALPGAESYYAFDYANVAFVISTGGVFLEDGTIVQELAELDAMLASASARRLAGEVDFVAVLQHYPLWTDHETRGPLNPSLVAVEEQILQRHQVDLLLVGHDHFYERSVPMVYGQPADAGYVQVISGGGGQSLYEFVPPEAFQSWSAHHAKRFHAVLYDVAGGQITARVIATDVPGGEEIDRFSLTRRPALTLRARGPLGREAIAAALDPDLPFVRRSYALCDLE